MKKINVIAIDGPSGCGKSSVTKFLAQKHNFLHINSGALFRVVSVHLRESNYIDEFQALESEKAYEYLKNLEINYELQNDLKIELNKNDLTAKLYDHSVSDLTSKLSKNPSIRKIVCEWQVEIATKSERVCIVEGRDIGTVIFPNAKLKIFLTASAKVRGERRFQQLKNQGKLDGLTLEQLIHDIEERDIRDSSRQISPLKRADDAIEIDTTSMTESEVIDKITALIADKGLNHD